MQSRQALVEVIGTASWLLMDLFWMVEQNAAAMVSGVATVAAWFAVFAYLPRRVAEFAANGVVVCWAGMNLLWMAGEMFDVAWLKTAALVTIIASFVLLALAVWKQGASETVTGLFKRFRMPPAKQ